MSGEVSVHIAKGGSRLSESSGLVRTFDPQWLIPPLFLDLAEDHISRDIKSARLGEIVLTTGEVTLRDFKGLISILGQNSIRSRISNSNTLKVDETMLGLVGVADPKSATNAQKQAAKGAAFELILDIIKAIPNRAQYTIRDKDTIIWGLLREEGLIVSYEEIMLTHGASIPGIWNVVGLLDGHPDEEPAEGDQQAPTAEAFSNTIPSLASFGRKTMGRPYGTFAVTPLMIFRELPA
jgi:hypothetical protein